jgi:uncharacterized protein (TIGR03435 family)
VRHGSGFTFVVGVFLVAGAAFAQMDAQMPPNNLSFETPTIQPSAPIPVDAKQALARKIGVYFNGLRAEFDFMPLRDLILYAYGVKPTQLKGPEWLADRRRDIAATMPAGSSKDDAPLMLQALLEDRFELVVHRENKKQQVMALVIAKVGTKLVDSASVLPPATGEHLSSTTTPQSAPRMDLSIST